MPSGRSLSGGWAIAAIFCVAIALLGSLGTPVPAITTGDIAPRTVVSRAAFEALNIGETNKRVAEARERALSVYVDEQDWRSAVTATFGLLMEAGASPTLDEARNQLRALSVPVDGEPVWRALSAGTGPGEAELTRVVSEVLAELEAHGVISDERMNVETRSGRQGLARRVPPEGVKLMAFAGSGQTGVMGESAARRHIARALRAAFPEHEDLTAAVIQALQRDLRASLDFSPEGTRAARDEAAKVVAPVRISVPPGEVIVVEGQAVGPTEEEKIRQETIAYHSSRPLRERLARFGGTFLAVAFLAFALGWTSTRLESGALKSKRTVFFVSLLALGIVAAARGLLVTLGATQIALTPVAFAGMVLALAVSPMFGVLASVALAVAASLATRPDLALPAMLAAGGAVGAMTAGRARWRSDLLRAGAYAGIAMFVMLIGVKVAAGVADYAELMTLGGWALLNGLASGFLTLGLLPLVEAVFGVTTDISLLELSDQNHPALRRLLTEAPGTFHHSLIVGNLSEAACNEVGANALLARVASYYHDIGKINRPEYFIENEPSGRSRHDGLSPTISSLIITSHVRDGVALARQYRLPATIVGIVQQHHGTSLIEFFYRAATERAKGATVDEVLFRHSGPKPLTREAGIVLLADAVEAASRSLTEPTSPRLAKLVSDLAMRRLLDGQFDECGLTFQDLRVIEESFVKVLVSMFHSRVPYPKAPPVPAGLGAAAAAARPVGSGG